MSRNNRQRRADGRDGRRGAQHGRAREEPPLEDVVQAAVWFWTADPSAHAETLDRLDARAARGEPVLATVQPLISEALDHLWEHGWTPADAVHITTRELSTAHADVVSEAIVADGRSRIRAGQALHPRWRAQLDVLDARRPEAGARRRALPPVRVAVTVLCLLVRLSPLPPTVPGPGQSSDDALGNATRLDERMLARVRALLAKAESTEFEEEADALTAKAQELIARHAIAEALLHTPDDVGEPSVRRVHLDDPYGDAKAALLAAVADANRCSAVHTADYGWLTVFGYDHDLDAVELLGASLLTQATSAMVRHGSRRDAHGRSTTRSFRRSFLLGFAHRIGERLRTATEGQVAASQARQLLPVLAARDDRLRAARDAAFPATVVRKTSISNSTGWVAGQAAADVAELAVAAERLPHPPGDRGTP